MVAVMFSEACAFIAQTCQWIAPLLSNVLSFNFCGQKGKNLL
jgi:hypothetical protein